MEPKFTEGQRIRVAVLYGTDGRPDRRVQPHVGRTGTVVKVYCAFREQLIEKGYEIGDVYCCDVRLDGDGGLVCGLPEVALEPAPPGA